MIRVCEHTSTSFGKILDREMRRKCGLEKRAKKNTGAAGTGPAAVDMR